MLVDLEELLTNLKFDFGKSFKNGKSKEWEHSRLQYHRIQESIKNQILYFTAKFQKTIDRPLNIGFMSPDITPETSEIFLALVWDDFKVAIEKGDLHAMPKILTRRKTLIPTSPQISMKSLIDWSSPTTFASFDLIVIFCGNSNIGIMNEIAQDQINYDSTVFFVASSSVGYPRIESILKTKKVVLPYLEFGPKPEDINFDQSLQLKIETMQEAVPLPDLGIHH